MRPHFARTWLNQFSPGRAYRLAIPPDGCVDLQWIDGTLRIAGPDRHAHIEEFPAGATVIGMRFQPGSAATWLRVPASELVDARLPLDIFWGREARRIAEWVGEARCPEDLARRLEAAMARRAATIAGPPNRVSRAVFRLLSAPRQPRAEIVGLLSDRLGMSERTLRRTCHSTFGYGPKALDRILRFQRFLRTARTTGSVRLADLAGESGYADQAHLSREARRMADLTPAEILAQLTG